MMDVTKAKAEFIKTMQWARGDLPEDMVDRMFRIASAQTEMREALRESIAAITARLPPKQSGTDLSNRDIINRAGEGDVEAQFVYAFLDHSNPDEVRFSVTPP